MKSIVIVIISLLPLSFLSAQITNINTSGTVNVCSGTFVDPGGASSDYGNNQNYSQTICSNIAGECGVFMFNSFETTNASDYLEVYDGASTAGTFLYTLSGGPSSVSFPVASSTGCLTFVFHSNNNQTDPGWVADISCIPCPITQSTTQQDCIGAIPVCQEQYYNPNAYIGIGSGPDEISSGNTCLGAGEINDAWYVFTAQTSGNLSFVITPNNPSDDYDWAVFDITANGCAGIFSGLSPVINCNFTASTSAFNGQTGANSASPYNGTLTSIGAFGAQFNASTAVIAGNTYVINVSNFSSSQADIF
jgi:hypothetical protein